MPALEALQIGTGVLTRAQALRIFPAAEGLPVLEAPKAHVGHFRLTGVVADAETVTIGGQIYEYDDNGVGNFPGGGGTDTTVQVDVTGDLSATNGIAQLVAAANLDAGREAEALVDPTFVQVAHLVALATGAVGPALATTCVNGLVSAANMVGGEVPDCPRRVALTPVSLSAEHVLAMAAGSWISLGGVLLTEAPAAVMVQVERAGDQFSSAGLLVRPVQVAANYYDVLFRDAGAVLLAADVVKATVNLD